MKKPKGIGLESTRVLRSGASRKRSPESSASSADEIAPKRIRSEPAKEKGKELGRSPKSKDNAVPRVLPRTKKVSGENPERGKKKLGRPPKSSLIQKKKVGRPPKSSPILKKKMVIPPESLILVAKKGKEEDTKAKGDEEVDSRAMLKQKIRDRIKKMLLSAGWTIDLRPRNGRDYMDAVYIPPAPFKGSYWSVTKAYSMYLEHQKSSEMSAADPIPKELLGILARQTNPDIKRSRRLGPHDKSAKKKGNVVSGRKKKMGCTLLVRNKNKTDDDYVPYPWKRTVLSWMIDSGVIGVDAKVSYVNKKQKEVTFEGSITREGIRCGCCSNVITLLEFEAHAGGKLGNPYENIVEVERGISLLQCQVDAWEKQSESEHAGFCTVDVGEDDPSDDTCCICGDGGELVCCDGCPSTYHLNCLGIEMLPPGDWHCRNCSCKFCGQTSDVSSDEDDPTVSPLLPCSQCEQKFHHGCSPDVDAVSVSSDSQFCGQGCKNVYEELQKLLGIKNDLEGGFSWTLIRRVDDASGPLCNRFQKAECNSKIAVALAVMEECFLPIVDQRSGIKLIHNIVYNRGSNISRLDYRGFYTFILERGDEIISVASVRIHETKLAEMPYIGTRDMYRRQGMCRRLLNGIESALRSLNVEKLIIPAISELTETWTGVFGFHPLENSHKQEARSINLLVFPDIGLLLKPILEIDSAEQHTAAEAAELESNQHDQLKVPNECSVSVLESNQHDQLKVPNECSVSVLSSLGSTSDDLISAS